MQGKSDNYGAANFIVWPGNYNKEERFVVWDMNTQGGETSGAYKNFSFKSLTRSANLKGWLESWTSGLRES